MQTLLVLCGREGGIRKERKYEGKDTLASLPFFLDLFSGLVEWL
jgi:hypothetical protein